MTQINLLPWREEFRRQKKLSFALILSGFIILTLFFIVLVHIYINSLIDNQQNNNNYLQSQITQEQKTLKLLQAEQKIQAALNAQLQYIFALRNKSYKAVRLLDELPRVIPDAVSLTKIIRVNDDITVIGKAQSNLQVTQLMKNMFKTHIFNEPVLTTISGKENSTEDKRFFQLKVQQQE